jgi:6-phosphofructokinase
MKITIVTSTGKTVIMDAKPEETIADVKTFVFNVTGIHQGSQRLMKDDVQLDDSKTLSALSITEGDTLIVRLGTTVGNSEPESGDAGMTVIVLVVLAILAAIVFAAKKLLFGKPDAEK